MSIKDNQRCLRELLAQRAPQVAEPYEAQLCHLCCLVEFSYGWIRNRAHFAKLKLRLITGPVVAPALAGASSWAPSLGCLLASVLRGR